MIPWVLYGMPDLFIDWIETKPGMAKTQILVKIFTYQGFLSFYFTNVLSMFVFVCIIF